MFVNSHNLKPLLFVAATILGAPLSPGSAWAGDLELCNHSAAEPVAGIQACTRLIERPGEGLNVPALYNNRGVAKVRKSDFASAIQDFNSALDRNPNYADAYKNRGLAHQMQRDYDAAIADFNHALRLNAKSPDLYNARGSALFNKEAYDRAIADFDKAILLDPKYMNAFVNRGLVYQYKRQLDRAIADFDTFVRLAPENPLGYVNRAAVRMDKADFKGAVADFDRGIELDPQNAGFYTRRGEAWRLLGDLDRALADHNKAIDLRPDEEAYNNRALTFKDQGKLDKAIADCDEAIVLNPAFFLAYANRGMIRRLQGDLWGSLTDLNKAVNLSPSSPIALTFRGDTLRESGDTNGAMKDFNRAILILPDFVAAYAGRGLTYEKTGEQAKTKAKADYEKALSLSADLDAGLARPAQEIARARLAALAADEDKRAKEAAERSSKEASVAREKVEAAERERAEFEARTKETYEARLKAEVEARAKALAEAAKSSEEPAPDPGRRLALVIGNSAYNSVAALPNPARDAKAMAEMFRTAGFDDVTLETNIGVMAMRRALRAFAAKAAEADTAVVFYAGHGVEIGGRNYLIPVDAILATDIDVEDEAVDLDRVLQLLDPVRRLKLVILDACRDNPFASHMRLTTASRSIGRGLAPPAPQTSNTLVAYAARAGAIAADGEGRNSPFTAALLHNLTKPGLDVRIALGLAHDEVLAATSRKQEPFLYGALGGGTLPLATSHAAVTRR